MQTAAPSPHDSAHPQGISDPGGPAAPAPRPDRAGLPPGPPAWNVLGFFKAVLDPEGALPQLLARYGDPFTSHTPMGAVVITTDPAGAREIYTADAARFDVFSVAQLAPLIGEHSLLLKAGPAHRADRRVLLPPFHGARMRAYGRLIQEVTRRRAAAWAPGRPFIAQDTAQLISLEVIIRAVFGVVDAARVARFEAALQALVAALHPLLLFSTVLRVSVLGRGPWPRFLRAKGALDALLEQEITRRRQADAGQGDDILGLLLAARTEDGAELPLDQIRDHLLTLLFAGHETTAVSLAWALYWLHREDGPRQRLLDELAPLGDDPDPEVVAALPYLDAVCQETLRLHPVIPLTPGRRLREPMAFMGWSLPAGVSLAVATAALHQRPDLYPEPRRFRPERFLSRSYSPFEFAPFGGGARRCIGAAFAVYEMKLVLAELLRRHELALCGQGEPKVVRRNFSTGPRGGIPMVLLRRR